MNWKTKIKEYDSDTIKILEIIEYFIDTYFPSDRYSGKEMMYIFFSNHKNQADEDFIHYYTPTYIIAAWIYYVVALEGDMEDAYDWILENGYGDSPKEVIEYFKLNFFDNPMSED